MQKKYKTSACLVLILILISVCMHQILFILLESVTSAFIIKKVNIRGIELSKDENFDQILSAALEKYQNSLVKIDIAKLKDQLVALEWIKHANIYKNYPHTLKIEITEKTPAVMIQSKGDRYVVDETGVILPTKKAPGVPILNIEFDLSVYDKIIQEEYIKNMIRALTSQKSLLVHSVKINADRKVRFLLNDFTSEFYIAQQMLSDHFIEKAHTIMINIKNKNLKLPKTIDIQNDKTQAIGFFKL